MYRQPSVSVNTPPRIGPTAVLMAAAIAHAAVALARSTGLGNAAAVMASPCGNMMAAPTPWMARAASSSGSDGAAAQTSEAATKVTSPMRRSVRLPNLSPRDPAVSRTAAKVML
jgi:hypothetical protein